MGTLVFPRGNQVERRKQLLLAEHIEKYNQANEVPQHLLSFVQPHQASPKYHNTFCPTKPYTDHQNERCNKYCAQSPNWRHLKWQCPLEVGSTSATRGWRTWLPQHLVVAKAAEFTYHSKHGDVTLHAGVGIAEAAIQQRAETIEWVHREMTKMKKKRNTTFGFVSHAVCMADNVDR